MRFAFSGVFLGAVGCFLSLAAAEAADPAAVAIGWGSDDGQVLLGELGCAACHDPGAAADTISTKQAPILSEAGARITPQYLRAFLSSPHEIKPGTTMPDLLHAVPTSEREEAAEALVHFLVSLGGPIDQRSSGASLAQIERGKALYHSVGCVACHQAFEPPPKHKIDPLAAAVEEVDPETGEPFEPVAGADELGHAAIPLGDLAMKTTVDVLAAFLDEPLKTRPSGRMPAMNLGPGEARMLAAYLLRDQYSDKETAPGVGLDFAYYQGNMPNAAELDKLTPKQEGDVKGFDLQSIKLDGGKLPGGNFGVRFHGLIDVPEDGMYRFWTKSDDGSVLLVDGKTVVNNDGMHPPTEKEGSVELRKGRHTIELAYMQGGGGYELSVHWQPPGAKSREPVPAGVLLHSAAAMIPKGIADFKVDPDKATRGRQLFASIGCASCHSTGDDAVKSTLAAPPLAKLDPNAADGCLGERVAKGRPKFSFSGQQRLAVQSAVATAKNSGPKNSSEQLVDHTMTAMNCYACHRRNDKGGPAADREDYFTYEVVVDLGEEGRMPPPLNEAGAKLSDQGFDNMLFKGQRYRTYMATRMPQYGKANVGHLPGALAKADEGKIPPHKPEFSSRMVDDGRLLVGKQKLACINCHVWGDMKLTGVEGMDLQKTTQRLQPGWFRAWLADPSKLKPGTRMPTSWPNGESFFPDIQDGDMDKQIDAIWAYLSVGEKGGSPPGLAPFDQNLLVPSDHPITFRTFLDGVSAHAIAVGFRQRTHVAFDANRVRMVEAWTGDFLSAKPSWDGRAGQYAKVPSNNILRFPEGPPLAILESQAETWPADVPKAKLGSTRTPPGWRFRGYRFDEDRVPTFLYSIGSIDVEETPSSGFDPQFAVLTRRFKLTTQEEIENLYLRVATGDTAVQTNGSIRFDDRYNYTVRAASEPFLRPGEGGQELLVPIKFSTGKPREANLEIRLTW